MENLKSVYQSESVSELFKAMIGFHGEYQAPEKKGKGRVGNRSYYYMKLDDLLATMRPILCKHKLFVMQEITGEGLVTTLAHESGEYRMSVVPFSRMDGNKGTNSLQEIGGGLTYFKRYALAALLGISDKDDLDGEDGGTNIKQKAKANKNTIDYDALRDTLLERVEKIKDNERRVQARKYVKNCNDSELNEAERAVNKILK